jgi:hypothetical protein
MSNKNESLRPIASDFDGLMTDLTGTTEKYEHSFNQQMAQYLGMNFTEYQEVFTQKTNEIRQFPEEYEWDIGNGRVAPACADPFMLHNVATELTLKEIGKIVPIEIRMKYFKDFYCLVESPFREGARNYIEVLAENRRFVFVTNSETNAVKEKLNVLIGEEKANEIEVIGQAKKIIIDNEWTSTPKVPQTTQLEGFPKPIFLWRGKYKTALDKTFVQQENGYVIGDVYELDLALPDYLDLNTILLTSSFTPQWEERYYSQNNHKRHKALSLNEIITWVLQND